MTAERIHEVDDRGFCVLRGQFPRRVVENCRDAFWPVLLDAGDVLIRHRWVLHRGSPNTTDTPCDPRRGVARAESGAAERHAV